MHRNLIKTAAAFGALSVILGALGGHTLKDLLAADQLSAFQTGVTYQFYHALALLGLGILYKRYPNRFMEWAGYFFVSGMILFSGSLYMLAFIKATKSVGIGGFGLLTPLGGILLVAGWISFFLGIPAVKNSEKD